MRFFFIFANSQTIFLIEWFVYTLCIYTHTHTPKPNNCRASCSNNSLFSHSKVPEILRLIAILIVDYRCFEWIKFFDLFYHEMWTSNFSGNSVDLIRIVFVLVMTFWGYVHQMATSEYHRYQHIYNSTEMFNRSNPSIRFLLIEHAPTLALPMESRTNDSNI